MWVFGPYWNYPPKFDDHVVPLAPGQQVTTESVPAVGRVRCRGKQPPPSGFYGKGEVPPPPTADEIMESQDHTEVAVQPDEHVQTSESSDWQWP